ncbi:hypothetical protein K402DRAFT_413061 [Aulographum hederae CBS 113979]|uniref:WIBG Mago-binding domain-containing protein n=1 Tax=Aulographum hederae CBS 113979 TaxID=1176131 RepID=A0A6G1GXR7_9PEZI|nr:hypothetical protein K402DRAFT_413061 [Aulographum hederae CBS 113979]
MATENANPALSKSGILTDENGVRKIPASVRADGSVRKEIRIKPGYRPPEDAEVYRNRKAESWKSRGTGGVPGADPAEYQKAKEKAPTNRDVDKSARKREAKKKAAEAVVQEEPEPAVEPEVEKAKKARNLAKKLRQARDLSEKKAKGNALLPEQIEKVIKINELTRQLDALGFNADGEKKESGEKTGSSHEQAEEQTGGQDVKKTKEEDT